MRIRSAVLLVALTLAGCGGGSSAPSPGATPTPDCSSQSAPAMLYPAPGTTVPDGNFSMIVAIPAGTELVYDGTMLYDPYRQRTFNFSLAPYSGGLPPSSAHQPPATTLVASAVTSLDAATTYQANISQGAGPCTPSGAGTLPLDQVGTFKTQ